MLSSIKEWFSKRRAERADREEQGAEDFVRSEDEARRDGPDPHDIAEDRVQHPANYVPPV